MEELIKLLDEKLEYKSHEIEENDICIYVKSSSKEATCPYCREKSSKVYLYYERKIQDLPIQGKKVQINLELKNYFSYNTEYNHKTFAERFNF